MKAIRILRNPNRDGVQRRCGMIVIPRFKSEMFGFVDTYYHPLRESSIPTSIYS